MMEQQYKDRLCTAAVNHLRQGVRIPVDFLTDASLEITESDIILGSFSIDRYCASGEGLEVGSAIAAELNMVLDNTDGKFKDYAFEGAVLNVYLRVYPNNADEKTFETSYGRFTVDEVKKTRDYIEIRALDDMVAFDKAFTPDEEESLSELLDHICNYCGVLYDESLLTDNTAYAINEQFWNTNSEKFSELTARQVLQWIAQITGTCAYIDDRGMLQFAWYGNSTVNNEKFYLTDTHRFSSDFNETKMELVELNFLSPSSNGMSTVSLFSDETEAEDDTQTVAMAFDVENNLLVDAIDIASLKTKLETDMHTVKYIPFSAECISLPFLWPLDEIIFVDHHGYEYETVVTHHTFRLNGTSSLKCCGSTLKKSGYASANPLTQKEAYILEQMKLEIDQKLTEREEAIVRLNSNMGNCFGMYSTIDKDENGASIVRYHNAESLAESAIVYEFTEAGLRWTDNYNAKDSEPVWQSGIGSEGSIIASYINTLGLTTSQLLISAQSEAEKMSILMNPNEILFTNNGSTVVKITEDETKLKSLNAESIVSEERVEAQEVSIGKINLAYDSDRGSLVIT